MVPFRLTYIASINGMKKSVLYSIYRICFILNFTSNGTVSKKYTLIIIYVNYNDQMIANDRICYYYYVYQYVINNDMSLLHPVTPFISSNTVII